MIPGSFSLRCDYRSSCEQHRNRSCVSTGASRVAVFDLGYGTLALNGNRKARGRPTGFDAHHFTLASKLDGTNHGPSLDGHYKTHEAVGWNVASRFQEQAADAYVVAYSLKLGD